LPTAAAVSSNTSGGTVGFARGGTKVGTVEATSAGTADFTGVVGPDFIGTSPDATFIWEPTTLVDMRGRCRSRWPPRDPSCLPLSASPRG